MLQTEHFCEFLEKGYVVRSRTVYYTENICTLGSSNKRQRYILVLKVDASNYVRLKAIAKTDTLTTREVLLD